MKKLLLSILLIVSGVFVVSGGDVEAAKTMYVNAKSDVVVREKPNKDAKQAGTIKNKTAVMVVSTANGWSYVESGNLKGYVYASALSAIDPNAPAKRNKTTMYVQVKNEALVREKPSKDAKQVGKLKNNTEVQMYTASNGWSYVESGNVKGYMYSSALTKTDPKISIVSGATKYIPQAGLTLKYVLLFNEDEFSTYKTVKKKDGVVLVASSGMEMEFYRQTSDKYEVILDDVLPFISMKYPFVAGKTVTSKRYGSDNGVEKVVIESTTKTETVKAGTFENVVVLKLSDGTRWYLAKGIGMIKETYNGFVYSELVSVTKTK